MKQSERFIPPSRVTGVPQNGRLTNLKQLTVLIMPEPTFFLHKKLGTVSIISPTSTQQGGAVAAVLSFAQDGLFLDPATNRNTGIVDTLMRLAEQANQGIRRL